jgi:4a-hydroxytetrahydrobiopterin dehydratase
MKHYNQTEISTLLPTWFLSNETIEKKFSFKDFKEAFNFMTIVATYCNTVDHHPIWSNEYNKVTIQLSTHSEGAITKLDIEMATYIDQLYSTTL